MGCGGGENEVQPQRGGYGDGLSLGSVKLSSQVLLWLVEGRRDGDPGW